MSFQKSVISINAFIIFLLLTFSACSSADTTKNAANANLATANITKANANNPLVTTKKADEETVNKAETIAPVVAAYCDAMRKKDDAALRKIYSRASLQKLEADMKAENEKSLAAYLSSEPVGDKPCEVRNEQIKGDKAVAEIRTETYPNGIKVYFVKEDGAWKITDESPEFEVVKQSSTNSNK
ncbi:MAG: hypothetical protein M3Q99_10745 [Acidobacteriota bacterium]|nr:hypothetical protein [Acidobacteriota bacterium]